MEGNRGGGGEGGKGERERGRKREIDKIIYCQLTMLPR